MYKPKEIEEKDLPLTLLGQEKDTCKNVYRLTSPLDSNLILSLKYNGYYIQQRTVLQSGETINDAWVK